MQQKLAYESVVRAEIKRAHPMFVTGSDCLPAATPAARQARPPRQAHLALMPGRNPLKAFQVASNHTSLTLFPMTSFCFFSSVFS